MKLKGYSMPLMQAAHEHIPSTPADDSAIYDRSPPAGVFVNTVNTCIYCAASSKSDADWVFRPAWPKHLDLPPAGQEWFVICEPCRETLLLEKTAEHLQRDIKRHTMAIWGLEKRLAEVPP